MIKKIIAMTRHLLEEYSPLALAVLVIPFFLPVEPQLHRRLLLIFCTLPGLLLTLLNPKAVFKNPVLLLMMLFVAYFSAQHIRGMRPVTGGLLRQALTLASIIIFPAVTSSYATPERKLYPVAIQAISLIAASVCLISLFRFYSANPFPSARFRFGCLNEMHTITGSWKTAFAAILAGSFLLQCNREKSATRRILSVCFPVLLAGTLYTHTRTTALALLISGAITIFRMHSQPALRRLTATSGAVFLLYLAGFPAVSLFSQPRTAPAVIHTESAESYPPGSPLENIQTGTTRPGGILTTEKYSRFSAAQRFYIWQDHLSRMRTAKDWLIGHGLGMRSYVQTVFSERAGIEYHFIEDRGYQLHPHSGYIWAIYHGGLIGFEVLFVLLAAAGFAAFRAGNRGLTPLALIIFCAVILAFDTKRLLAGAGNPEYLLFWIPLGLAAAQKQSVTSGS